MKMISLFVGILIAQPAGAWAQAVLRLPDFERQLAEIPKPELRSLQDLCRTLWQSRDTKELLATLQSIDEWSRPVSQEDESTLVQALKVAASNPTIEVSVRARAVHSLGKACAWIGADMVLRDAMSFLAEIVQADHPMDSRRDLRLPALMGLAKSIRRAPASYQDLIESILGSAFKVLRDNDNAQENFMAVTIVYEHVQAQGLRILLGSPALAGRVEYDLIAPLEGNPQALYSDRNRSTDFRYQLIRLLRVFSRVRDTSGRSSLGQRSLQVLRNMRHAEPDPSLRRLVEFSLGERRF